MKFQQILLTLITLGLGIFIGRLTVRNPAGTPSAENPAEASATKSSSVPQDASRLTARPRERASEPPAAPRIFIPPETGRELLTQGKYLDCSFETMDGRIDQALALLGASASQRQEVKALFEKTKNDLLEAEKKHVGVRSAGPSTIYLNMFDMEEPAHQIIQQMRGKLNGMLDSQQAETLNRSINWSAYYRTDYLEEISLEILRMDNQLYRSEKSSRGHHRSSLDTLSFPPDSQSVPAAGAFKTIINPPGGFYRSRDWSHLLGGKMLVPVQAPSPAGG